MSWKKLVLALVWGLVVVAWLVMIGFVATGAEKSRLVIYVSIAAVVTEVAFWVTAGILGVSIFEGRKRIWAMITGNGREKGENGE